MQNGLKVIETYQEQSMDHGENVLEAGRPAWDNAISACLVQAHKHILSLLPTTPDKDIHLICSRT